MFLNFNLVAMIIKLYKQLDDIINSEIMFKTKKKSSDLRSNDPDSSENDSSSKSVVENGMQNIFKLINYVLEDDTFSEDNIVIRKVSNSKQLHSFFIQFC